MEIKVRAVETGEPKGVQEVEKELLEKHEQSLKDADEAAAAAAAQQSQDDDGQDGGQMGGQDGGQDDGGSDEIDLDEKKVLSYIEKRYNKQINSFEELVAERKGGEDVPADVAAYLKYRKETGRGFEDFLKLEDAQKRDVLNTLNDMISKTYSQRYIAQMRQYSVEANNHFTSALNRIQVLLMPKDQEVNEPKIQYIKQSNVRVSYSKTELKTAEDVEEYVEALKEELLRQIKENRRITL